MLARIMAAIAGTGQIGVRTLAFIAITIAAALVSWLTPIGFFILAMVCFGCWWSAKADNAQ